MAESISAGSASLDDCVVLKAGKTVILKISGSDVPMGEFVQGFVKSTTMGMMKTLKKADIKEGIEPERAAQGEHLPDTKYYVNGSTGQGEYQQHQCRLPGSQGDFLYGISA